MNVHECLVLDHFYIAFPSEEFEQLLMLTNIWRNCSRQKVRSGNDSWEGIYTRSRVGSYFEILKDGRVKGFGLAFSALKLQDVDTAKIIEETPHLSWKTGTRVRGNGDPWFDWFSLGDYLDIEKTFFNAWIMSYHQPRRTTSSEFSVNRFVRIHLTIGRVHKETVRVLSEWIPGKRFVNDELIRFLVPDRDGNEFEVLIELVPGESKFEFRKLELELSPDVEIKDCDLGVLSFRQQGHKLYLNMKRD